VAYAALGPHAAEAAPGTVAFEDEEAEVEPRAALLRALLSAAARASPARLPRPLRAGST